MSGLMPASETESSFADAERAAFIRYRTPDLLCGGSGRLHSTGLSCILFAGR
jgi:hypothetical protein